MLMGNGSLASVTTNSLKLKFLPFLSLFFGGGLSQISNQQWLPVLIFQMRATNKGAISLGARCGYQMQRCVKASSSNSPLTEGPLHACEGDGCILSPPVSFRLFLMGNHAECGYRVSSCDKLTLALHASLLYISG